MWAEDHRWQSLPSTLLEAVSGIFLLQRPDKLAFKLLLPGGETGLWFLGGQNSGPRGHMTNVLSIETTLGQSICL